MIKKPNSAKYSWPKSCDQDMSKFIFISYSHKDAKVINIDLNNLLKYELPLWYDEGMTPGDDWYQKAKSAITHKNCIGIIFYISNRSVVSPAVYEELKLAVDKKHENNDFSIYSVHIDGFSINKLVKEWKVPNQYIDLYSSTFYDDKLFIKRKRNDNNYDHIIDILSIFNKKSLLKKEFLQLIEKDPFDVKPYNGNYIITGYHGLAEYITIPAIYKHKKIIAIGQRAFENNTKLRRLVVQNGILEIHDAAFIGCTSLLELECGNTLVSIGYEGFKNCSKLKYISFPDSLISIGDYSFYLCKSLAEINFNMSSVKIGYAAFSQCISLERIILSPNTESIGDYAFGGCPFKTIDVYGRINEIGEDSFVCNSFMETIAWHGLEISTKFANRIIALCPRFRYFTVPFEMSTDSVNRLLQHGVVKKRLDAPSLINNTENSLFWNPIQGAQAYKVIIDGITYETTNSVLEYNFNKSSIHLVIMAISYSENIVDSVTDLMYDVKRLQISHGILYGGILASDGILKTLYNVISIASKSFYKNYSLRHIDTCATTIEDCAFSECINLESIIFGKEVIINQEAFRRCTSLRSANLERAIKIGKRAFSECINLQSIIFNENIRAIEDYAFYRCYRATKIMLPYKLEIIGDGAFRGCMAIKEFTIPDSVRIIGNEALTYMIFSSIKLPSSLTFLGEGNLQNCTYLKDIQIQDNSSYSIVNGALCYKQISIIRYPPSKEQCIYQTSNNITHIEKGAFRDCVYLKEFYGLNILFIDDYAFADCPNLELVELPNIKKISSNIFTNCKKLKRIDISKSNIVEINLDSFVDVQAELIVNNSQYENWYNSRIWRRYKKIIKVSL